MVYCGKPSKGCSHCRKRKIKCDQAVPSCSQCARVNRPCPGYRNQLDLLFRDETQRISQKASGGEIKQNTRHSSDVSRHHGLHSKGTAAASPVRQNNIVLDPSRGLSTDLRHQAICFYLSNFSFPLLPKDQDLHLEFMESNRVILSGMASIGMATLSNVKNSPEMYLAAKEEYTSTISLTNAMLRDPVQIIKPIVLDAVMLLRMFETITCRNQRSVESWGNHAEGIKALLQLRSPPHPNDSIDFQAFTRARSTVLSTCLFGEDFVPPALASLPVMFQSALSEEQAYLEHLTTLFVELTNLRASIRTKVIVCPETIVSESLALEDKCIALEETFRITYPYRTAAAEYPGLKLNPPDDNIYGNYCHIYPSFSSISIWNAYRAGRIMVNNAIMAHYPRLSQSSPVYHQWDNLPERIQRNKLASHQFAADICATFPFQVDEKPSESSPGQISTRAEKSLYGFMILWPLFVSGSIPDVPPSLRKWAINRLEHIGHTLGINQALRMADLLAAGGEIHMRLKKGDW